MSVLTRIILITACLLLLLLPACTQAGTQPEPPQTAAAGAVETLEPLPPAPSLTATLLPTTSAAGEQQASAGNDSGAALELTEERPSAGSPSPEPTAEPTAAPSATPRIVVTQTAEALTPRATVTATVAEAQDSAEETPTPTGTPIDEAVAGAVFGNSGTTADLVERGISLDVTGLAATYAWLAVPISEGVVNPLPRHILLTFDDDDPGEMAAGNGRRMVLFPLRPYLALYVTEGQSDVADQVARLRELIDTAQERASAADQPPGDWMPLLPLLEDGRLQTWEQFAAVDFAGGRGVRYLSDYSGELTYYYQGLSEGDRYYLSLIWPLVGEEIPELQQLDGLVASFTIGERGE
ncbi:MAG: hypothetical protein ACK2U6_06160 [Candidatus Promineifilaceae bacterium]